MNKKFGIVSVLSLILIFVAAAQTVNAQFSIWRKGKTSSSSAETRRSTNVFADEARVFDNVNQERRRRGLQDLQFDRELSNLARRYSQQMADGNFFSHHDRQGWSVVERARANRVKGWKKIGENLFYYQGYDNFTSFAVKQWMKSASHRANILDAEFNRAGLGIAESRDGKIYITQVFLRK